MEGGVVEVTSVGEFISDVYGTLLGRCNVGH